VGLVDSGYQASAKQMRNQIIVNLSLICSSQANGDLVFDSNIIQDLLVNAIGNLANASPNVCTSRYFVL